MANKLENLWKKFDKHVALEDYTQALLCLEVMEKYDELSTLDYGEDNAKQRD